MLLLISAHNELSRLPILRILSEQSRRFLLGAEQHNRAVADIKAWRNQGLQTRCSEQFHWQLKTALWPGEGRPVFRRVSRCVRSAILLAKASVYPLSPAKANVGRFVDDCAKTLLMCDTH